MTRTSRFYVFWAHKCDSVPVIGVFSNIKHRVQAKYTVFSIQLRGASFICAADSGTSLFFHIHAGLRVCGAYWHNMSLNHSRYVYRILFKRFALTALVTVLWAPTGSTLYLGCTTHTCTHILFPIHAAITCVWPRIYTTWAWTTHVMTIGNCSRVQLWMRVPAGSTLYLGCTTYPRTVM